MFLAARSYVAASGDDAFLRDEFYPAAKVIVGWHQRGTHHGVHVDPVDGLLVAGSEGTQLTWMDARVDGRVITPRHGNAVEINALWYNALRLMADWARRFEPTAGAEYAQAADRVVAAFTSTFWNPERRCLYDVVNERGPDARLRHNQIFAVSLPFPLLSPSQRTDVVRAVEEHSLTHVGLRTLAPGDPGYIGSYRGGPAERDGAYHQGTIWPWLLGPYIRAYLHVFGRSPERIAYCRALFRGLELHLNEACLGLVSEVFDADPPFSPGGAPAQAWSVAELLQVLTVDLDGEHARPAASLPQVARKSLCDAAVGGRGRAEARVTRPRRKRRKRKHARRMTLRVLNGEDVQDEHEDGKPLDRGCSRRHFPRRGRLQQPTGAPGSFRRGGPRGQALVQRAERVQRPGWLQDGHARVQGTKRLQGPGRLQERVTESRASGRAEIPDAPVARPPRPIRK
jgi:hypothetical protein